MAGLTSMLDDAAGFVPGVHPTAHIEADAVIGDGASIGAFTYIAGAAQIGSNARIAAHVSIGQEAVIGDDALIHAGVQIAARVRIGDRFVCQMGAVIGGDGFSFVTADPSAAEQVRGNLGTAPIIVPTDPTWHRIHSLGSVVIADDVEIGANTCVDAGTVRPTHVGRGTKIDNLVQIGHNAVLGQDCLICGQSGVAGSAVIGDRTVLGGRTAIADNLTVGADVVTGVGTTIMSNVAKGRMMLGYPAVKMDAHVDGYKALRRLPRTLEAIKVRLGKLEQG
jgi:UDP-3-O-[3-hydroxymyristoyl] glucosamine N-acyltransferase